MKWDNFSDFEKENDDAKNKISSEVNEIIAPLVVMIAGMLSPEKTKIAAEDLYNLAVVVKEDLSEEQAIRVLTKVLRTHLVAGALLMQEYLKLPMIMQKLVELRGIQEVSSDADFNDCASFNDKNSPFSDFAEILFDDDNNDSA